MDQALSNADCFKKILAAIARHPTAKERQALFVKLVQVYFTYDSLYQGLYASVDLQEDFVSQHPDAVTFGSNYALPQLIAKKRGSNEYHGIEVELLESQSSSGRSSGKKVAADRLINFSRDSFSHSLPDGGRFSKIFLVTDAIKLTASLKAALQKRPEDLSLVSLKELEESSIDWSSYDPVKATNKVRQQPKKKLRDYQKDALEAVLAGFQNNDRGKLIMACGTGKTFTALQVHQALVPAKGRTLFLVPSLALLAQSLREWKQQAALPMRAFAVCSDSTIGQRAKKDRFEAASYELAYPSTTQAEVLAEQVKNLKDPLARTVIFSTYQSLDVIHAAQTHYGMAPFDLIVCDEAHRTTGQSFLLRQGQTNEEAQFVRVHDPNFLYGKKRLYMTATPRIFAEHTKQKARQKEAGLFSMDDAQIYGPDLYVFSFREAVERKILVDYKVVILAVDEAEIAEKMVHLPADSSLSLRDYGQTVAVWKALAKETNLPNNRLFKPMQRAIAFAQVIEPSSGKVSSKKTAASFQAILKHYKQQEADFCDQQPSILAHWQKMPSYLLECEAQHIDGTMDSLTKQTKLDWLKEELPEHVCRILCNVRCLVEGVDLPALDAVIFLSPKDSALEVVQAVGRVMRRPDSASHKECGYVILPILRPAGKNGVKTLASPHYKVLWQVINALRAHDPELSNEIARYGLFQDGMYQGQLERVKGRIEVIESCSLKDLWAENSAPKLAKKSFSQGSFSQGVLARMSRTANQSSKALNQSSFLIGSFKQALMLTLIEKCGNKNYWNDWLKKVQRVVELHRTRMQAILNEPSHQKERAAFQTVLSQLKKQLNDQLTSADLIDLLCQHLVSLRIFDALFQDAGFSTHHPIAQSLTKIAKAFINRSFTSETEVLEDFYQEIEARVKHMTTLQERQGLILEVYEKFFKQAFPKAAKRLGIVYTPSEIVDFILQSLEVLLQQEFQASLGDKGVLILEPFAGTGTFLAHLLSSGLIPPNNREYKFQNEIFACEIMLLAYYIASVNIEQTFHFVQGGKYKPFLNLRFQDTFAASSQSPFSRFDPDPTKNTASKNSQKTDQLRVIVTNPPYSVGQTSENDNNQNLAYPALDQRITETYAKHSSATSKRVLYDSYIRAIRWASDQLGENGIFAFISGSGFIDKPSSDGIRKCLAEEYSKLYIFNLRGDIRKNILNPRAGEGENVFGSGSMSGIAISFLVKNKQHQGPAEIYYHAVPDHLKTSQKLELIQNLQSIAKLNQANLWQTIRPNTHHDWLDQRESSFYDLLPLGNKRKNNLTCLFSDYTLGLVTNRDAWCYHFSRSQLEKNLQRMLEFYQQETERYHSRPKKSGTHDPSSFVDPDPSKIAWTANLKRSLLAGKKISFEPRALSQGLYRPFTRSWVYYHPSLNGSAYKMSKVFPLGQTAARSSAEWNRVICVSGKGARNDFSVLMANSLVDLNLLEAGAQCFPLYLYERTNTKKSPSSKNLALPDDAAGANRWKRTSAISKQGFQRFQTAYPHAELSHEDVFYYVYGLLHSTEYRNKYQNNLSKELPHLPILADYTDFLDFQQAGRRLAKLHVDFDQVPIYDQVELAGVNWQDPNLPAETFQVKKMKWLDKQKTSLIYNDQITLHQIPPAVFLYQISGKSALEWVVDRQTLSRDSKSGIENDANLWANETLGNPRYPLELVLRVITLSLETMKIIQSLPKLDFNA